MSMLDDPNRYTVEKPYKGKMRKVCTVFPDYGWVALGSYHNKCGGLDGYPDTEMVKKGLWYTLKHFPDYHIIMEGILPSTVYSTYEELFHRVQESYPQRTVIVLNLMPPLQECLRRIQSRNGGKPIKEDLVASKWATVAKNADKFSEAGILSLKWDNSQIGTKCECQPMIERMMDFIEEELDE